MIIVLIDVEFDVSYLKVFVFEVDESYVEVESSYVEVESSYVEVEFRYVEICQLRWSWWLLLKYMFLFELNNSNFILLISMKEMLMLVLAPTDVEVDVNYF